MMEEGGRAVVLLGYCWTDKANDFGFSFFDRKMMFRMNTGMQTQSIGIVFKANYTKNKHDSYN
jgi:hypothetical protein